MSVAHILDEIGLEHRLFTCVFAYFQTRLRLKHACIHHGSLEINFFYAVAVKHEHPLVDLELIYVELAHQLNNFDCLFGEHGVVF